MDDIGVVVVWGRTHVYPRTGGGYLSAHLRRAQEGCPTVSRARTQESYAAADGLGERSLVEAREPARKRLAGPDSWAGVGGAGHAPSPRRSRPSPETAEARRRRGPHRPGRPGEGGNHRGGAGGRFADPRGGPHAPGSGRSPRGTGGVASLLLGALRTGSRHAPGRVAPDRGSRLDARPCMAQARDVGRGRGLNRPPVLLPEQVLFAVRCRPRYSSRRALPDDRRRFI